MEEQAAEWRKMETASGGDNFTENATAAALTVLGNFVSLLIF